MVTEKEKVEDYGGSGLVEGRKQENGTMKLGIYTVYSCANLITVKNLIPKTISIYINLCKRVASVHMVYSLKCHLEKIISVGHNNTSIPHTYFSISDALIIKLFKLISYSKWDLFAMTFVSITR